MSFQVFPTTSKNLNPLIISNQTYIFINEIHLPNEIMFNNNNNKQADVNRPENFESQQQQLNLIAPSTMRFFLWMICIIGILLNIFVFRKQKYSR